MSSFGRFSGTHAAWVGFSLLQPPDNWTGQRNTVEYGGGGGGGGEGCCCLEFPIVD